MKEVEEEENRKKGRLDVIKSDINLCGCVFMKMMREIVLSGGKDTGNPSQIVQVGIGEGEEEWNIVCITYCNDHETTFGWDYSCLSNMKEFKVILETHFMIRYLKSELGTC